MKLVAISAVGLLAAAPAFAGGMAEKVEQPAPVVAVPVAPAMPDWTGWYGGAQLGMGHTRADGVSGGSGAVGGLHFGYLQDMGNWVYGGELNYNQSNMKIDGTGKVNHIAALELKAGPKVGKAFVYGVLGYAQTKATFASGVSATKSGPMGGIGMDYALDNQWSVGGQIVTHRFGNVGAPGVTLKPTTATVNVSYHF